MISNADTDIEIVDDDDDEDGEEDGDDDVSETSSLVGDGRSRSFTSSLPTSRKPSPLPGRLEDMPSTLFGRVADTFNGLLGGKKRRDSVRGQYDSVGGYEQ